MIFGLQQRKKNRQTEEWGILKRRRLLVEIECMHSKVKRNVINIMDEILKVAESFLKGSMGRNGTKDARSPTKCWLCVVIFAVHGLAVSFPNNMHVAKRLAAHYFEFDRLKESVFWLEAPLGVSDIPEWLSHRFRVSQNSGSNIGLKWGPSDVLRP